ncbi:type II secretion system F family protein [Phenylobacterium sp.]|uniref:type II secretion system F family protein n=1 Tax=Phenylobacterium sp. TaxID=1871053 RepID=UPI002DF1F28E|nr:type II secretion system F family protein [Phenylobacterium sp.]
MLSWFAFIAGFLALASLAAGLGLIALVDNRFDTRLGARLQAPTERARPRDLQPAVTQLLSRWGARAGRGAVEQDKRTALRTRLVRAGFYSDRAVEIFFGLRVAAAAGLAAAGFGLALVTHQTGLMAIVIVVTGANLGLFLPNLLLERRIAERRRAMRVALPDAIDLMIVSVEAGAALSAALQRVAREFDDLHPIVSEQFGLMLMEMQAGASRAEALARLAARTPSDEVGALTSMIIQSEAVGASLGGALRAFSEELRKTRHLDAERRAAELPVKIAFPLVFCIFPAMSGVLFTPVVIRIFRTLLHG